MRSPTSPPSTVKKYLYDEIPEYFISQLNLILPTPVIYNGLSVEPRYRERWARISKAKMHELLSPQEILPANVRCILLRVYEPGSHLIRVLRHLMKRLGVLIFQLVYSSRVGGVSQKFHQKRYDIDPNYINAGILVDRICSCTHPFDVFRPSRINSRNSQADMGAAARYALTSALTSVHKVLVLILIIVTLLTPGLIFADDKVSPRIGFVLPLSGEWALLGNGIRNGALLAQEDLRAKGEQVEFIFEDNQGELKTSATIGAKLTETRKVDALISIISGVGRVLNPLATRAQIINIGICSETEIADGEYNFINYLTAEQGVSKFLKQLGPGKSLGIFSLNESGFQKITGVLKVQSRNTTKILFEDYFDKGTVDFRSILTKRKSSPADTWLILGLSPEIETLVKQARDLGIRIPVVSIEAFGLAQDTSPFEGAWFIDSAVPNEEFRNRFLEKFGYEVTPGVGHSYDSVMMLAEAFIKASDVTGKFSRQLAVENFRRIKDFKGVIGALSVNLNGVIWSEPSVKVIKNGKPLIITP